MSQPPIPVPPLAELQAYVDTNAALHDAVGAPRDARLELRPFAQGEYNANYAFEVTALAGSEPSPRHLLLRVNLGSQMGLIDQIGYEVAVLRLLEPSGRVPRVFYIDSSRANICTGVAVEELLPGRPLRYETDLPQAAGILADIHAVPVGPEARATLVAPHSPLVAMIDECAQMFAVYTSWPQADKRVISQVDRLFARAEGAARAAGPVSESRRRIINTELNSGNFLINDAPGARSYLVDWEKPLLAEVEQDLAHFLAPTTTFWKTDTILTPAQMDAFVVLYEHAVAGRFDTTGLRDRLPAYLAATCLRGVTWCAMAYCQYLEDGRSAANPVTFAKIAAYLGEEFLASL